MLINKRERIDKSYEVIIVGSGLAGMTAANKLGKMGRKVLLLESHNKLGGYATWFRRQQGKYIFDVSLHGFPFGMVKTCKKYWNREIADSIVQLKGIRFVNPQFSFTTEFTREDFTDKLINYFKIPPSQVDLFFDQIFNMNFYDHSDMTNGELLEKFFPGRSDVRRFLLEPITYANGSTLEDPAITYGIVFSNFMNKGVFTFKGGTDVLIDKMQDELIKNGVDIKLHSRVEKVQVEEGSVRGVILDGKMIEAKSVLSNSNLLSTIFDMTGAEFFSNDYVEKAKKVRMNTSSCQVYFGIRRGETIPNIGDLIFHSTADEYSTDKLLALDTSSRTFSVYYPAIRPQLDNLYTIVSSTNARYEDWSDLNTEQYEERKKVLIDDTLNILETLLPDIRSKIDFVEAATPLTFERYVLHKKGSSFGTKFEGLDISMKMHEEVDGLFHSGSVGIIMSGWLGAANYGVIQTHEIENYLSRLES